MLLLLLMKVLIPQNEKGSKKYPLPLSLRDTLSAFTGCDSVFELSVISHKIKSDFSIDSSQFPTLKFIGKTTNATGRVIASKGTLLLRADAIEIRQDTQGQNFMIATGSTGNPVFMRQKREGLNEFFEAQASRIERDEKTQMIRLIGKAVLRRLVGNALADEIQGETVIYNEATEAYTVASGAAGGVSTSGIPSGRVRAMITPRSATTASPARGRTSTSSPAVPLQPSPQIGTNHE